MWNAGMEDSQAAIKIARRNINNLRYENDTTLMAESEEELKSLLWEIDGEIVETVSDFILGAPKSLQMVWSVSWSVHDSHVISEWSVTWWVYDHSRDLYMVATWSLHDQPSE